MKNIIILCDGTGNEISENISNVLKFYRCLRKTDKTDRRGRWCFTIPASVRWRCRTRGAKLKQNFDAILGLATGYGLDDKVLQSYLFLVRNYGPATASTCSAFPAAPTPCGCWRG